MTTLIPGLPIGTKDIILFLVGLLIPSRTLIIRLVYLVAIWTGQDLLRHYIDEHFPHIHKPRI